MKKVFTLFLSLLFVSVSWAQDSMSTALELGTENSWTYDSSVTGSYIYWKYEATDAVVINPSDYSASVVEDVDGTETSLKSMQLGGSSYGYIARAGHTVYVRMANSGSDISFTVNFLSFTGLGDGETEDNPLTIVPGETQVVGQAINTTYYSVSSYATYTATEDGVLVITSQGYGSIFLNGSSSSMSTSAYNNGYVYEIQVTAGETYTFRFYGSSPFYFTSEMTYPDPGELSNPIAIVVGENTNEVPAAAGTYYYTYTPSATGYGTISSEESLTGGNVEVYTSKSSVTSTYGSPTATSADGAFDVRFEITSTSITYYIEVNKTDATDDVQKFSFIYSDYAQGETEDNPLVIEDDSEVTLPYASGTYYYSYDVPANTSNKFLVVTATSTIENNTYVYVYPEGDYYWNGAYGDAPQQLQVETGDEAVTYIIKWISKETTPVSFTVTLKDIEQGDVFSNPLQAVLGENAVASGSKYYAYTPTKACKLTLEGNENIEMLFPKDDSGWNEYAATLSGVTYTLEVEADTEYYINTINSGEASTFYLSEVDFEAGDSRALPIDVSDNTDYAGTYTVTDANSGGVWLSYTVASAGILTIYCDAPFSYRSTTVTYYVNDDTYGSSMVSTDYTTYTSEYKTEVSAAAGDVYYVYLKGVDADYKVTFTMAEFGEGQSVDTAIEIFKDEEVALEEVSTMPMWYKVYLAEGTVTVDFDYTVEATWYTSYEDAVAGNGADIACEFWYTYDSETQGSEYGFSGEYEISAEEEGYHYIEITYNYAAETLLLSGDAVVEAPEEGEEEEGSGEEEGGETDGINAINADVTTGTVYNLSGMKVGTKTTDLPSGVYVVNANGKTRKVVVK